MKRLFIFMQLSGLLLLGTTEAGINLSGNVTGVSTYIWRGVKQNNGPALQSTANLSYKSLSFGVWSSSVDFGSDVIIETDPFVELALSTGALASALGAAIYTYDMFKTFNSAAKYEIEMYGKLGSGPFKFAGYLVPAQTSTTDQIHRALYWTETSAAVTASGISLSAMLGFGNYSSRALLTPKKEPCSFLVLSIGKSINQALGTFWSYQRELDKDVENYYYFGMSYSF